MRFKGLNRVATAITFLSFAMLSSPAASSQGGELNLNTLEYHQGSPHNDTSLMLYSPPSTAQSQKPKRTDIVRDSTCRFSTIGWRMHILNASVCLPSPSAISGLSEMYTQILKVLSDNSSSIQASQRIIFKLGALTLVITAFQPIPSWQFVKAVGSVLVVISSCAMCIASFAFTLMLVLGVYCGIWLVELVFTGRGQRNAMIG